MKRRYLVPEAEAIKTEASKPLAGSGVTSSIGIGYGGVDTDGELDPSVKEDYFDFKWE